MVFSMDLRVMICEGRRLARTASIKMRPASRVAASLSGEVAGTPESWMGEMPRISAGHGHGVGGELAAACARAGTGVGFESFKACVVDAAGGVRADAFEDILNGDVHCR